AQILQRGLHDQRHHADVIRMTMVEEFAMVEAPGLSILILALGAVSWIDDRLAINLALANGVAQLLLWGIVVARQLGLSWSATPRSAAEWSAAEYSAPEDPGQHIDRPVDTGVVDVEVGEQPGESGAQHGNHDAVLPGRRAEHRTVHCGLSQIQRYHVGPYP